MCSTESSAGVMTGVVHSRKVMNGKVHAYYEVGSIKIAKGGTRGMRRSQGKAADNHRFLRHSSRRGATAHGISLFSPKPSLPSAIFLDVDGARWRTPYIRLSSCNLLFPFVVVVAKGRAGRAEMGRQWVAVVESTKTRKKQKHESAI